MVKQHLFSFAIIAIFSVVYMCPPRPSITINVSCKLDDVNQDCTLEVPDGTVARMYCKPNYIDASDGPTTAMCLNGTWTAPVKNCTPGCNYIDSKAQPLILSGMSTKRGDFPWHVGIYRKEPEKDLTYLCGGSIISVKVVISAAHCFYDEYKEELYPVFEYSVAAGKLSNEWDAKEDKNYVQKRKVTQVYIKNSYLGLPNRYEADIAVVVVDELFIFSDFIHAVCVDWNLEFTQQQLKNGALGKVAGWGFTSTEIKATSTNLNQLEIPLVDREKCLNIVPRSFKNFITLDKFCAGYRNGSSVCNGDSGGGLVFSSTKENQSYYSIQGIVSTGPTFINGTCNYNEVGVYTKVSDFILFIKENEKINRGMKFCVKPSIPNAEVAIESNGNATISGELVRNLTEISIHCNADYTLVGDETATCISGKWNITMVKCVQENILRFKECRAPVIKNGYYKIFGDQTYIQGNPIPNYRTIYFKCKENFTLSHETNLLCVNGEFKREIPTCLANCKPISEDGHEIQYVKYGSYQKPDNIEDGTTAFIKCSKYYTYSSTATTSFCRNGSWVEFDKYCIPECGDLVPEDATLMLKGTAAEKRKFPWHVAIYRQIPGESLKLICGGTLISDTEIMTAADCFPEDARYIKSDLLSEYSIAAGKYFSDWDAPEDVDFVQKRKVYRVRCAFLSVFIFRCYAGIYKIEVDTPFTLSDFVKPVCIDWNEYQLSDLKGRAVGWGASPTKNSTPSVALQEFTVTYVDREQCSQKLPRNLQKFLTNKTFCATYTNESSTCNEDVGAGIFYPLVEDGTEKYYIRGIKTLKKNRSNNQEIGLYRSVRRE